MGRYNGKTCRLIFMLVITALFFLAELVSGYLGNSIAPVSDSFNMLSDLISLCVGISALRLARFQRSPRFTYGLPRTEVLGALSNAVFLTALCFTIFVQALMRLVEPQKISDPELVLIVGALGLAINIVGLIIFQECCFCKSPDGGTEESRLRDGPDGEAGAFRTTTGGGGGGVRRTLAWRVFGRGGARWGINAHTHRISCWSLGVAAASGNQPDSRDKKKDDSPAAALNIRGVLLHVLGDALGSVVVVVAATIFYIWPLSPETPCNWECYVDPSLTVIMVIIIMSSAFPLLKETAGILLQMVPEGVDGKKIGEALQQVPGVQGVHELHMWELAAGRNVATVHVKSANLAAFQHAEHQIREIFHQEGIHSTTIQLELTHQDKPSRAALLCSAACLSQECQSQMCCHTAPSASGYDVRGYVEIGSDPPEDFVNGSVLNPPDEVMILPESVDQAPKNTDVLRSTHL
ncbi:zinc transporter 10-like [Erpetoichthys calabaricus]|uniref:zinc transporter 10-like n=1 Tax=Erpetoichthys calabaricus TaxID=27687 RepID=UPI0022348154|nr:zinc transporter 10-like [Erpetoichthys calabaricus]